MNNVHLIGAPRKIGCPRKLPLLNAPTASVHDLMPYRSVRKSVIDDVTEILGLIEGAVFSEINNHGLILDAGSQERFRIAIDSVRTVVRDIRLTRGEVSHG
ncbi:hypothetical protein LJR034_000842 [Caballeronia sp. LjRoot34]|uniref:hypothetical protein n=1 Tax=Caballeronia sp. LjRoot34 TaxID=3342325 RepID=UPI003ED171BD